ncbi:MAG: hypothetical protein ACFFBD_02045 [Candidatus Hodarchaeota archaeon]
MAIKIKTFTSSLDIFKTVGQLSALDEQVNNFIIDNGIRKLINVSDAITVTDKGTQGIIRVLAYEIDD